MVQNNVSVEELVYYKRVTNLDGLLKRIYPDIESQDDRRYAAIDEFSRALSENSK